MHRRFLSLRLPQVYECPISQSRSWPSQQQCEEVGGLPRCLDTGRHGSLGTIIVTVPTAVIHYLTYVGLGFRGSNTGITGKLSSLYSFI